MDTSTNSVPESTTAPSMTTGKMRIGFGKRFWAALLDAFIAIVIGYILGSLVGSSFDSFTEGEAIGGLEGSMAVGVWIFQLINIFLEGSRGASIGKMIVKIQIKDQSGTQANNAALWKRTLVKNISFLCLIIATLLSIKFISTVGGILGFVIFIGCFFVLGKNRQAFHDMLAKTAVYSKKDIA